MLSVLQRFFTHPLPAKNLLYRHLTRAIPACSDFGRPAYQHCIDRASYLAQKLGVPRISVIEFGVGKGAGLLAMERLCARAAKRYRLEYEIYGFDLGTGLPKTDDVRDLPYLWTEGYYRMDQERLQRRLTSARLILGDVAETAKTFFDAHHPAPIGCIVFDLDYYTSTRQALSIFSHPNLEGYLPRIECYFDDAGTIESVGERLAIKEFNAEHGQQKIENSRQTQHLLQDFGWKIFEYHDFRHPRYATLIEHERP